MTDIPMIRLSKTLPDRVHAVWQRLAPGYDLLRSVQVLGAGLAGLSLWVALSGSPAPAADSVTITLAQVEAAAPAQTPETAETKPPAVEPPQKPVMEKPAAAPAPQEPPRRPATKTFAGGALDPVPDLGLIEESPYGLLPRIGADGREPREVYARPASKAVDRTPISLVIHGIGLSEAQSLTAIEALPPAITLALSPFAERPQRWINRARAHGHEMLMTVPMEPHGFPEQDPGPGALLTRLSVPDLLTRLHKHLSRATGYVGVLGLDGDAYLANSKDTEPVLADLAQRGLGFVSAGRDRNPSWPKTAAQVNLSAFIADRRLDERPSRRLIDLALLELEALALAHGKAIGVGEVLPVTLDQIRAWEPTLAGKGLVLVPVSAMMAHPKSQKHGQDHAGYRPAP